MLGLAHNCESPNGCGAPLAAMVGTAAVGETHKRTLHVDGVVGICTIYPAGKSTPMPIEDRELTGGGCATGGGAAAAGLLLAAAALLRLRRRR
jgi:MYXO-CTERM domain-containing protein